MQKITLSEGIFKQSQLKGKEYLIALDIDRLVSPCYEAVGRTPKKERYGGWEAKQISGHSLGHWLSAASAMYDATGDEKLREKLVYALSEIEKVQSFDTEGYVSGFPRDCFDQVFSGDFEVGNFSLGGSWVPWYAIHKIYAGLIDAYQIVGMELALEIVMKLADWAHKGLSNLSEQQFQRMLICEHGGMNEVFADLYSITGDIRYLELAEKFCHQAILEPLARKEDNLEGKHANTQIPKVIGAAKLYNITGNKKYQTIASYFWHQVVNNRTYAIGGNSIREHFGPENTEKLGILTAETCNTFNMLKLTELLFDWNPNAHYYDYYERALYNHILASQDPDSGMKTYFVSTEPGHFKVYHSHDNSFWCCTGTGMENPARYQRRIFEQFDNTLYVHLFIGAEGHFNNGNTIIKQKTSFPYQQSSRIKLVKADDTFTRIAIRKPFWVKKPVEITINGKKVTPLEENGYMYINRNWNTGDVVEISLPTHLHLYSAKDDDSKQVIMYGPLVLAGALGTENFPETDILENHLALNNHPLIEVPTLVADKKLEEWVILRDEKQLVFETEAIGQPGNKKMTLKPFYDIHHERYTIYWYRMTAEKYNSFHDKEKERKLKAQRIVVDEVAPYEQQPELEHDMVTKNSRAGYNDELYSGWREAREGGYFRYEMKVNPKETMYLQVTYNKSDTRINRNGKVLEREFTIYVNEHVLANEHFNKPAISELYAKNYRIPDKIIDGHKKITITFASDQGKITAGVYHIRILKEPFWE